VLKIDRSFVHDIATSPDDAAIVAAIVTLADTLKMRAIAEGVESPLQRGFLHEQGCELMQGHLFGKPTPAPVITDLLRLQQHHEVTAESPLRAPDRQEGNPNPPLQARRPSRSGPPRLAAYDPTSARTCARMILEIRAIG